MNKSANKGKMYRLDEDIIEKVRTYAFNKRITQSAVVQEALNRFFNGKPKKKKGEKE